MPLSYVGELSIGALCPLVLEANAALLVELQAKLAGVLELSLQLTITPPTIAVNLDLAVELVATLTASIEIGLPGIDFQITAVAALLADLNLTLGLLLALQALLGAAGIFVYEWEGPASEFGPALSAALTSGWPNGAGVSAKSNAIVLATVSPVTWTALKTFFGGA